MTKFFGLMMLLVSFAAEAKVIEIQKMKEISPYIDAKTLVVFDFDNTIMEPAQTLGSDQWFEFQVKKLEKRGLKTADAIAEAIRVWKLIQSESEMQPVERSTPALVKQLQRRGITVMGLTARPRDFEGVTREQLRGMGVEMETMEFVGPELSKGQALVKLLKERDLSPSRVVFVDDKPKHVKTVDQSLTEHGIQEHFEFRYGAADPKVKSFHERLAELQLEFFEDRGEILSDEQGMRILFPRDFSPSFERSFQ